MCRAVCTRCSSGIRSILLMTTNVQAANRIGGSRRVSTVAKYSAASTTSTTPASLVRPLIASCNIRASEAGSATPLASTIMASSRSLGWERTRKASSSPLVSGMQHRHPPAMDAASSTCPSTSAESTLIAPKSLMTTPSRAPGARRRWLRRVVFPAPKYPVRATTGILALVAFIDSTPSARSRRVDLRRVDVLPSLGNCSVYRVRSQ